jgi:3-phenylpropionate/cinnamic acid dioxygenase small subunit
MERWAWVCLEMLGNVVAVRVNWILITTKKGALHGFFLLVTALFIVCS